MAISVKTQLRTWSPVYNKLVYCVTSDNYTELNFKYIFRVYVTGVAGYKEYQVTPEPELGYGIIDVHNYVQAFVTSSFGEYDSINPSDSSSSNLVQFYINTFEMWDVAGVPTLDPDGEGAFVGNLIRSFGASFDYATWLDWDSDVYLLSRVTGTDPYPQFLTEFKTQRASINDLGWTYYITSNGSNVDFYRVITYDSNGDEIDTYDLSKPAYSSPEFYFVKLATAPQSLNNIDGSFFVDGAQPVITSDVSYYTVQVFDTYMGDDYPASELLTFHLDEPCRYEMFRLHFENKFGGFDSFNFIGRNQRNFSVERSSYKMSPYNVDSKGVSFMHQDKSNVTNWTKRTDKIRLKTDYLSQSDYTNLQELIYSNEIYLEFLSDDERNFKSVHKVTQTGWDEKITDIDKLFRLEVEIEIGQESYSQRK